MDVACTCASTNAGATKAPSSSMTSASGCSARPTESCPIHTTTPSVTAIAVASGA